jgi:acetylornithine deacetylase/succinyl-diaminopimelate desuccinylase-like protein
MFRAGEETLCRSRLALFLVLFLAASTDCQLAAQNAPELRSGRIAQDHLTTYSDLAVEWLQEYLRIDTTNPPGNELKAAQFFKAIFDREGIENQLLEYRPGRADFWARIPHTGSRSKRAIILLNHMDVVTSSAPQWKAPPFSGETVDGSIYGRGAQDMKNEAMAQLLVLVMAHREHIALDRDLIFLAVSDEEADGSGTDWLLANRRELLEDAEFLINEGGQNLLENQKVRYVGVDVGEKIPFWVHLVAHGRAGHGSRPIADSAPNRLVRALDRLIAYRTPYKVLPVVEEFLRDMAPYEPPERARRFRNVKQALRDPRFRQQVDHDESLNFLLRNTISVTMLQGAEQTNVIPSEAWANLDVRLLPGENGKQFLRTLRRLIDDPDVTVEPLPGGPRNSNYSPTNTDLYKAIRQVSGQYFPGVPVVPLLASGYTESQRYRPTGIVAYGFTPFTTTGAEGSTEHGDDERIRVEEVQRGPRILFDVVMSVAAAR